MKVLCGLLLVGALCAPSSVSGQTSRICESFNYSFAAVENVAAKKPSTPREFTYSQIREIERPAKKGGHSRRISFIADPEELPPVAQDMLRIYTEGMKVRVPFMDEEVSMFVKSGIAWELGKDWKLTLPYIGGRNSGFKLGRTY